MTSLPRFGYLIVSGLLAASTIQAQQHDTAEAMEFFEREVRPLLLENCVGCHSQSVNKVKGGLNMDSRSSLIAGGDSGPGIDINQPENSLILEAVRRQGIEMPPDKPLSNGQVKVLERWLKMGAPWPEHAAQNQGENWIQRRVIEHWSWQPIKNYPVPEVETSSGLSNPIDAFVSQKLAEHGLRPTQPANRNDFIRRLFVDLVGLPPTSDELQRALSEEDDARLIDQLLASPQFGVRWGRHWLDLMRYSETLGHEFDYPIRHAWRYRESVVNAFNDDLSYDRLIAEHIAGDLLDNPRIHPLTGINESLAATAWWWLGDSVHAPVDVKNDWATRIENQVDVFSKSFLGMTVACARCHDHKFDPIGMQDYYGMTGVAKSIRRRYAITDPHQTIIKHLLGLKSEMVSAEPQIQEAWQAIQVQDVERWLDSALQRWRGLAADKLQQELPLGSPLYPLRLLITDGSEPQFADSVNQFRQQLAQASQEYLKWQAESRLLAEFNRGLPPGWKYEAIAAATINRESSLVDWFDGDLPVPARQSVFCSDRLGRNQFATLRSPNFDLTHRCVCLKVRGKSVPSTVCVDGYFMTEVQGLLFADHRKQIDQADDWGWVVHAGDLNKYLGDTSFLSLESEAGGWFQIAEIRLSDRSPPQAPHPTALDLLASPFDSRQSFRAKVVEFLRQALVDSAKVRESSAESSTESSNRAEVARSMLRLGGGMLFGDRQQSVAGLIQRIQQNAARTPSPTVLIATEEGDPNDAAIELRGNPHRPGEVVPRGCCQSIVPWTKPDVTSSGRVELVASLTHPEHPLVARVIVNRVWYHLMGRGLANSLDNLGALGGRPTHPELLDYLSSEFMQNGWSIKWLIRQIVLSRTYGLSSQPLPAHQVGDPDGSLYSHRTVRRLDAEVLRDSLLQACGTIDYQVTGPSIPVYLTPQMTGRGRPGNSGPLDGGNRRSVFVEVRRNFLNPFLVAFDFPMPSTTTGKRNTSNVPAQALGLLNDALVDEVSQRWASNTSAIVDSRARVSQMISTAFGRPPSENEISRCLDFIQQSGDQGWNDFAHALINAKEFWYLK